MAVQFGEAKGRSPGNHAAKVGVWGRRARKRDTQAKVERIGLMGFPRRVVRRMEEHGQNSIFELLGHPSFS